MNPWSRILDMIAEHQVGQRQQFARERADRNTPSAPPSPALSRGKRPSPWAPPGFKSTRGQAVPAMQQYLMQNMPQLEHEARGLQPAWMDPGSGKLRFLGDDWEGK